MEALRRPNSKAKTVIKYIVIIALLVVIFGGGSFGLMYLMEHGGSQKTAEQEESSEQENKADEKKENNVTPSDNSSSSNNEEENDKKPAEYEGEDANNYENLSGYIINASIADQKISIRAAIAQATSGDCVFNIVSPSGKTSTGTSKLEPGPTSGFCILENLGLGTVESGTYKIDIILKSSTKTGKISGEVNV